MKLQIQILHDDRNNLTRTIADYLTREGILNSFSEMEKKAVQAGYQPIDLYNEDIYEYVLIPGYTSNHAIGLDRIVQKNPVPVSPLKYEYTESLQQWLVNELAQNRSLQ